VRNLYPRRRIHDENIDPRLDELIGKRRKAAVFPIGKTPLDSKSFSFDIAELSQSGLESRKADRLQRVDTVGHISPHSPIADCRSRQAVGFAAWLAVRRGVLR